MPGARHRWKEFPIQTKDAGGLNPSWAHSFSAGSGHRSAGQPAPSQELSRVIPTLTPKENAHGREAGLSQQSSRGGLSGKTHGGGRPQQEELAQSCPHVDGHALPTHQPPPRGTDCP